MEYKAIYSDSYGEEETSIHNDGKTLRMILREVEFSSQFFEDWEPAAETPFDLLAKFSLHPKFNELVDFRLKCSLPLAVRSSGQNKTAELLVDLNLGSPAPNGGVDFEHLRLKLKTESGVFESDSNLQYCDFEEALLSIRSKLPDELKLKCCFNCDFSDYSPYGHSLFNSNFACFREKKKEYRAVKDKSDLFNIWDEMTEFVQETHLCSEFRYRVKDRGYRG